MKRRTIVLLTIALLALVAAPSLANSSDTWPQWRGANGQGIAETGAPPTEWAEDKNVKWKTELPGLGTSTPVIWKDRIFVTTAVDTGKPGPNQPSEEAENSRRGKPPSTIFEWRLLAIDRATGKVLWNKVAHEGQPHEGTHPDGTHASNSPITDGETVYAFFGSQGIHAYDFDGNRKWHKDLGDMTIRLGFGEGASPALHGDRLVINWDHEGDSFVVALDKNSGDELWRRARASEATSWSTPLIVEHGGKVQVIVNATHRVTSYDLADGSTIWEASGMTVNVIPTPLYADGVVYVTSGFRGNATLAIKLDGASGDVTGTDNVLWTYNQDTPYVPTPVLYKGLIYMLKVNKGLLSVVDAATGELVYGIERLEVRNVYASAFAANDHVYFMGRDGGGTVIKAGRQFEVVANNQLDDRFDASPAAVGDELYLRGRKALYCIAEAQ